MKTLEFSKAIMIGLLFTILAPSPASLAEYGIEDSDIAAAVQRRLTADNAVHYERINVETKGGIVKLSGPVDNILAKERAVEIAKSTRGVRSVIDMIHAQAIERGDGEIRDDVMDALKRDPAVEHPDINVKVVDGSLTLTGSVDSFTEKYLAGRVAMGVKGVTEVKNSIQIEHKSERPDQEIKADIQGLFRDSVLIDYRLIRVQVENGEVNLTGVVGNRYEMLRATGMVNSVPGVKSVDTHEIVMDKSQGDEMRDAGFNVAGADEEVRDAIRDAFLYDPRVQPSQIEIEIVTPTATLDPVRTKAVILTGMVDNSTAKWAAEEDAMNTIGVSRVENHLMARVLASMSDSELLDEVKKALLADPQLGNFHFSISVLNGEVRLSGTVDSESGRQRAEKIASRVNGVVSVQNDLKIVSQ